MTKNFLTVKVKCKPLVKAYLESNFGNPVTIPPEHIIYKTACSQLFKKNTRSDGNCIEYSEEIFFGISEKNFNVDGHSIDIYNVRIFNTAVDNYIRNLIRTNLDSLLSLQEQQNKWKEKYKDLIKNLETEIKDKTLSANIRKLRKEVDQHQFCIKTAISHVVITTLKLNFDVLPYETIKKDYYRYRIKISNPNVPLAIKL